MKILITGHRGFIGSHLVETLSEQHPEVEIIGLDRQEGDLKELNEFPEVDVVVHLAAYNSTKEFYTKGFDVINDNIVPTLNLLKYYRAAKKKPLFVYTGTPESIAGATDYFNYKIPTDEDCPIVVPDIKNIRWSYANSKALGEQAVIASGLEWIIVRPNNIYGPRQRNHFVDEFIDRAKGGEVELYGYDNTRSWLFVKDFCDALAKVIFTPEAKGEIINVGSNDENTVEVLAEIIIKNMKIDKEIKKFPAPEGSVKRRMPDISKVKRLTGWEPRTSLEEGLKITVESYMT